METGKNTKYMKIKMKIKITPNKCMLINIAEDIKLMYKERRLSHAGFHTIVGNPKA